MTHTHFISAILVLAAGLASACSDTFSTMTIEKEESFALKEGRTDSLIIKAEIEYPCSGMCEEAIASMSDNITAVLLNVQYIDRTPQDAVDAYIKEREAEYRECNLPLLEHIAEGETSAVLNWEDYSLGSIQGSYKNIISYKATKYTYTGGAHGMTVESHMNFNLETGALLKESDLFAEGYEKPLSALLTAHLDDVFENPEDASMLFQKEIRPNGNFSVSEKGVTYVYNQYEIGAYALGIIAVTVPWEELKHIIKQI